MWKKEKYFKKMIYHTEMYDEIYDLTIHKKDFFFYAWNVIWKDSEIFNQPCYRSLYSSNSMKFNNKTEDKFSSTITYNYYI